MRLPGVAPIYRSPADPEGCFIPLPKQAKGSAGNEVASRTSAMGAPAGNILILLAALATTPAAAALQSERTVSGMEAKAGTIVLSTGERFDFSHPAQLIGFAPGETDGLYRFTQAGRAPSLLCDPDAARPGSSDPGQ